MNLVKLGISRARMTLVGFLVLLIGGVVSYGNISRESLPDVAIPIIYVILGYDGISPEDAERVLLRPVEERLRSIEGIKELQSTAYEGGANVILEFDVGFDKQKALDDVRVKVDDAKADLPEDASEPSVNEINLATFPILQVVFSGAYDTRTLTTIVEDIQDEVASIPSVLEANILGGRKEQLELIIDPIKLENYGITTGQISRQILSYNRLVTAGNVESDSGKFSIKLPGLIESYRDIGGIPIIANEKGVVRVSDISTIKRTYRDLNTISRADGNPAVSLEIVKRKGENTIETVNEVRRIVSEEAKPYAPELDVKFTQDESIDIKRQLDDLTNSVLTAIILVMIIILATLGVQSGILVSLSIPATLMTGLLVLNIFGLTLNIIVLFAIVLSVGMMVDATVVTVEFANRRLREGASPTQAYSEASRRMAMPIVSSTITTLAAFLPLIFMPGIVGKVMQYLPITLMIMLTASLVIALFFVPVLGAHFSIVCIIFITLVGGAVVVKTGWDFSQALLTYLFIDPSLGPEVATLPGWATLLSLLFTAGVGIYGTLLIARFAQRLARRLDPHFGMIGDSTKGLSEVGESTYLEEDQLGGFTRSYLKVVKFCLGFPYLTIVATLFLTVASMGIFVAFNLGSEFFPDIESDRAFVRIKATGNFSIEERDTLVKEVEQKILDLKDQMNEITVVQAFVGSRRDDSKGTIGRIDIDLLPWNERRPAESILSDIRYSLSDIAGIEVTTGVPKGGPNSEKAIDLRVQAEGYDLAARETRRILDRMEEMGKFRNTSNTLSVPGIEWQLRVDREKAEKGSVSLSQIGSYVRMATTGFKLTSYRPNDSNEEVDIVARFPEQYRNLQQLDRLRLNTSTGAIPIDQVVERVAQPLSAQLMRIESRPSYRIQTDVLIDLQATAVQQELVAEIERLDLDPNVDISFGGDQESSSESKAFLVQAFIFAFLLIFVILLAQFNSFMHCVIITSAIIISSTGVFIGHIIMQEPFGIIMSGIGLVSLAGIVVNNNIVLIDTFDYINKRVSDPIQAILLTCSHRLRPVLLTSVTTILGVLPSVFEINIDFAGHVLSSGAPAMAFWRQIAISIVFGMGFATIMTLVVTPVALSLTKGKQKRGIRRQYKFAQNVATHAAD